MAVITQTDGATKSLVPVSIARTIMTASDTLTYVKGTKQELFLFNTTASPVNVTLVGTAPTSITVPGYGLVSTAGGKVVTVPASGQTILSLDDIYLYLDGTGVVTLTGGSTSIQASLYT